METFTTIPPPPLKTATTDPHKVQKIASGERPPSLIFDIFAMSSEEIGQEASFITQIRRFGLKYYIICV